MLARQCSARGRFDPIDVHLAAVPDDTDPRGDCQRPMTPMVPRMLPLCVRRAHDEGHEPWPPAEIEA